MPVSSAQRATELSRIFHHLSRCYEPFGQGWRSSAHDYVSGLVPEKAETQEVEKAEIEEKDKEDEWSVDSTVKRATQRSLHNLLLKKGFDDASFVLNQTALNPEKFGQTQLAQELGLKNRRTIQRLEDSTELDPPKGDIHPFLYFAFFVSPKADAFGV